MKKIEEKLLAAFALDINESEWWRGLGGWPKPLRILRIDITSLSYLSDHVFGDNFIKNDRCLLILARDDPTFPLVLCEFRFQRKKYQGNKREKYAFKIQKWKVKTMDFYIPMQRKISNIVMVIMLKHPQIVWSEGG